MFEKHVGGFPCDSVRCIASMDHRGDEIIRGDGVLFLMAHLIIDENIKAFPIALC